MSTDADMNLLARERDAVLLARYLADQMADAERDQFEHRLATEPALAQELETTAQFTAGLKQLKAAPEIATRRASSPPNPSAQGKKPLPWTPWALAASLAGVLVLGGYWLTRDSVTTSSPTLLAATIEGLGSIARPPSTTTVPSVAILRTRTAAADATIPLPAGESDASIIKLLILPEDAPALPPYRLEWRGVDDSTGAPVVIEGLIPDDPRGFFTVFLNTERLTPGRYELQVRSAQATTSIQSRFAIRVIRPPPP